MHETFTTAFQELYPRARRLAQRILGDRAAAEDVATEALARAYAHWQRIGGSAAYRTGWVLRVTTNLAIDGVRGRNRPAADLTEAHLPAVADVQDGLTLRLTLIQALRTLPGRQREAVVLQYLAGLSQAEVARTPRISPGSVARHVHVHSGYRHAGGAPVVGKRRADQPAVRVCRRRGRRSARARRGDEGADGQRGGAARSAAAALAGLRPGDVRSGKVTSLVPFGAFVDLGDEVYGLLHLSELGGVSHPGEALEAGQAVRVEIAAISPALERVSLRLAGTAPDE